MSMPAELLAWAVRCRKALQPLQESRNQASIDAEAPQAETEFR